MKKIPIYLILLLFYSGNVVCQTTFQIRLGTDSTLDKINGAFEDSHGNILLVGEAEPSPFGPDTIPSLALFVKVNSNGDTVFCFRNQLDKDNALDAFVEIPNDSGYILGGWTRGDSLYDSNVPVIYKVDTNGVIQWQKRLLIQGQINGSINQLLKTNDGNLIVTGYLQSPMNNEGTTFLIKMDFNGNVIWQQNYSKLNKFVTFKVHQTKDGGYIAGGQMGVAFMANNSFILMKLDGMGSIVWSKEYRAPFGYELVGKEALEDSVGNIVGVGTFYNSQQFLSSIVLLKTDSVGNRLYLMEYGGPQVQYFRNGYGVHLSLDENAYSLGGHSLEQSPVEYPGILMKTNYAGVPIWTKILRAQNGFYDVSSVSRTSDGAYLISSYTDKPSGDREGVLVRLDSTGNGTCLISDTIVQCNTVAITTYNASIVNSTPILNDTLYQWEQHRGLNTEIECKNLGTGCAANLQLTVDPVPQHYNAINDPTGTAPFSYLWEWGDGSSDTIAFPSHQYTAPGFYTICLTITDATGCISYQCANSYLSNLLSQNNPMIFVNVISSQTAEVRSEILENDFFIYPNPSNGNFTISGKQGSEPAIIEIYDLLGQIIYSDCTRFQSVIVVNSQLKKGIYILKVKRGAKEIVKKIIIEE